MKKSLYIMVGIAVLVVAGVAYAGDDWTPFSKDNNLGVLMYNDLHAPAAVAKCDIRNYGPGNVPGIKDAEEFGPVGYDSSVNNIGILLSKETIPEATGSGAGGMGTEGKCLTAGEWKNFDIGLSVHSETVLPFR